MIVIDIGNTSLHFARADKKGNILKSFKMPSAKASKDLIQKALSKYPDEKILAVSVVPEITKILKNSSKKALIAGKDVKIPIKCLYNRKNIGMDRLVAAFAAKTLFPGSRLVLDFGTAITLDILSKKGDYLGGFILPGIGSTLKALSKCALLPPIRGLLRGTPTRRGCLCGVNKLIPKNTKESINKGMQEGFSLMINALISKYKKKLKIPSNQKVIITGGEAAIILPALDFSYKYEPYLVLKGLIALSKQL